MEIEASIKERLEAARASLQAAKDAAAEVLNRNHSGMEIEAEDVSIDFESHRGEDGSIHHHIALVVDCGATDVVDVVDHRAQVDALKLLGFDRVVVTCEPDVIDLEGLFGDEEPPEGGKKEQLS